MTGTGQVISIWVAPQAAAPMKNRSHVQAEAGRGLSGNRYARGNGTFSRFPGARREVTFIALEEIDRANRSLTIPLAPDQYRRNIVCTGFDFEKLINRKFHVGNVLFRGITTAGPCGHLAKLCGLKKSELTALIPGIRCGLRAQILESGGIAEGDEIVLLPDGK